MKTQTYYLQHPQYYKTILLLLRDTDQPSSFGEQPIQRKRTSRQSDKYVWIEYCAFVYFEGSALNNNEYFALLLRYRVCQVLECDWKYRKSSHLPLDCFYFFGLLISFFWLDFGLIG